MFKIHNLIFGILVSICSLFSISALSSDVSGGNLIVLVQDRDLNQKTLKLEGPSTIELRGGALLNGVIECDGDLTIIGNGNIARDFPFIRCNGSLSISDVSFTDFKRAGVFIEYSNSTSKKPIITLLNISVDGSGKIERLLRSYMNEKMAETTLKIENCVFTNITEYVVQFANNCTGTITNCTIHDIGNSNKSHVSGFWLGYQDEFHARNMVIDNNTVENIRAPYNTKDDGREAHGIIVYGNNNRITHNNVRNIYSKEGFNDDPGKDTEGIYVKGSDNEIAFNNVVNATGSGSDGSITIKHIGKLSKKNSVHDNIITDKYSNGIVIYTNSTRVYNNHIALGNNSECGIYVYCGKGITVSDNYIISDSGCLNSKHFSGGIVVAKCKDVTILHNKIENVPVLLNCINNGGSLNIENNKMEMHADCILGYNTKYTSCVVFQGENKGHIYIIGNKISGRGTRGSQIFEFMGEARVNSIQLKNNEIVFTDSPQQNTYLTYVIRNAPTNNLVITDNIIGLRGNYISSTRVKSVKRNIMEMSNLKDESF